MNACTLIERERERERETGKPGNSAPAAMAIGRDVVDELPIFFR